MAVLLTIPADTVPNYFWGVSVSFLPFRNAYNSSTPLKGTYLESRRTWRLIWCVALHTSSFWMVAKFCCFYILFQRFLCLKQKIEERRLVFWTNFIVLSLIWVKFWVHQSEEFTRGNSIYFSAVVFSSGALSVGMARQFKQLGNRMTVPDAISREVLSEIFCLYW